MRHCRGTPVPLQLCARAQPARAAVLAAAGEQGRVAVYQALAGVRVPFARDIGGLVTAEIVSAAVFALEVLGQQRARVDGGQRIGAAVQLPSSTRPIARCTLIRGNNNGARLEGRGLHANVTAVTKPKIRNESVAIEHRTRMSAADVPANCKRGSLVRI